MRPVSHLRDESRGQMTGYDTTVDPRGLATDPQERTATDGWVQPDARRILQLILATVWLIDGLLQLQPFMFTAGPRGFSGMLDSMASGNPHVVAQTITWNASLVDHHAVATDAAFALIQILIGLGIAWRVTVKPAMAASLVWALAVWWFGEGLGGVLHGSATPIDGGPGAVLFYALLAVLLWPADRMAEAPFTAASAVGTRAAKVVWVVVWVGLAVLALLGSGRAPQGMQSLIRSLNSGEPGWLANIDRHAASASNGHGLVIALTFVVISLVVAVGVYLPRRASQATLVLGMVTAVAIWVFGQNFGMVLAGGATDPSSGPLVIVLVLAYWPSRPISAGRFRQRAFLASKVRRAEVA